MGDDKRVNKRRGKIEKEAENEEKIKEETEKSRKSLLR